MTELMKSHPPLQSSTLGVRPEGVCAPVAVGVRHLGNEVPVALGPVREEHRACDKSIVTGSHFTLTMLTCGFSWSCLSLSTIPVHPNGFGSLSSRFPPHHGPPTGIGKCLVKGKI